MRIAQKIEDKFYQNVKKQFNEKNALLFAERCSIINVDIFVSQWKFITIIQGSYFK